jgi:hypothetical protein
MENYITAPVGSATNIATAANTNTAGTSITTDTTAATIATNITTAAAANTTIYGTAITTTAKLKQLRGFGPRGNYTDRATAACWRS